MVSCKEYVKLEKEKIKQLTKDKEYKLHIFQVGDDAASSVYTKNKVRDCEEVGIKAYLHKYSERITTYGLINEYQRISDSEKNFGVIFQLPLPEHVNVKYLISHINPKHDVDGFRLDSHYDPCTPKGIIDWLEFNNINLVGKNVCIIGRSDIVGKPLARMMTDRDATVTLCHSKTKDLVEHMQMADIIVVAVGKAKFIHDITLPKNPIMIDVGINRDENGKLCGDIDYDNMIGECSYITSVPGGCGICTRLGLMKNVIKTMEM